MCASCQSQNLENKTLQASNTHAVKQFWQLCNVIIIIQYMEQVKNISHTKMGYLNL